MKSRRAANSQQAAGSNRCNALLAEENSSYICGMTPPFIKVSRELRDRLRKQAHAEHRTLGVHLAHLASLEDKRKRFERLRAEIDATSDEDLASYREETEWWESVQVTR
ncbi:hypothetical protein [Brevibacterium oceani]|uniref:hypothetical protein n=1 Tax=Brevibacterium oceani TaxID=358099 RepID=UPI001B334A2C|nr:hypothetical protein [Brevibacterium oceani]